MAEWNLGGYHDWYADAACRDDELGLWFTSDPADAQAARAVCCGCPVEHDCLELALEHPELEGIWAGTDEAERARIRCRRSDRSRRPAAQPLSA